MCVLRGISKHRLSSNMDQPVSALKAGASLVPSLLASTSSSSSTSLEATVVGGRCWPTTQQLCTVKLDTFEDSVVALVYLKIQASCSLFVGKQGLKYIGIIKREICYMVCNTFTIVWHGVQYETRLFMPFFASNLWKSTMSEPFSQNKNYSADCAMMLSDTDLPFHIW